MQSFVFVVNDHSVDQGIGTYGYHRTFSLEKVKHALERCSETFGKHLENSESNVVVVEASLIKCIYSICKDKINYLF